MKDESLVKKKNYKFLSLVANLKKIYVFGCGGKFLSHFQVGCLDEDDGLPCKLQGIAINRKGIY